MSSAESTGQILERVDAIYQAESRRIFATLVRLLGDLDLAEDALHDAFRIAMEQWPRDGVPANPRAWLISAGRFKAIDALRRSSRFEAPLEEDEREPLAGKTSDEPLADREEIEDDRLRQVSIRDGPFIETKVQLVALFIINARDLNEAVRVAAKLPQTGRGPIEVRAIS